jgi:hypothetical protein
MGILIISVIPNASSESESKSESEDIDSEAKDLDKNKNALKLLTFILYYAYYNTFEEPINEHLYNRILDTPSEQSSKSFAVTLGEMLKVINKQSESVEDTNLDQDQIDKKHTNSQLIATLADLMAESLEGNLFEGFETGKLKRAKDNLIEKLGVFVKENVEQINSNMVYYGTKTKTSKYTEESKLYRLLNQQKYMYIMLALKTISTYVEAHNNNLLYKLRLESEEFKKAKEPAKHYALPLLFTLNDRNANASKDDPQPRTPTTSSLTSAVGTAAGIAAVSPFAVAVAPFAAAAVAASAAHRRRGRARAAAKRNPNRDLGLDDAAAELAKLQADEAAAKLATAKLAAAAGDLPVLDTLEDQSHPHRRRVRRRVRRHDRDLTKDEAAAAFALNPATSATATSTALVPDATDAATSAALVPDATDAATAAALTAATTAAAAALTPAPAAAAAKLTNPAAHKSALTTPSLNKLADHLAQQQQHPPPQRSTPSQPTPPPSGSPPQPLLPQTSISPPITTDNCDPRNCSDILYQLSHPLCCLGRGKKNPRPGTNNAAAGLVDTPAAPPAVSTATFPAAAVTAAAGRAFAQAATAKLAIDDAKQSELAKPEKLSQDIVKSDRLEGWETNSREYASKDSPGRSGRLRKQNSGIEPTEDEVAATVAAAASGAVVAAVTDGVTQYIPIISKILNQNN